MFYIYQDRLSSLGVMPMQTDLTENTDLDSVVNDFTLKKTKKGTIH